MKRITITVLLIFLAGILASPALARTTFISIGTGGTGGIYYPYGGGVAEIWSKYVKGVKAVAEVTGASVENVKLAHKGETVVGEVMGDVAVAGFNGLSKFQGKNQKKVLPKKSNRSVTRPQAINDTQNILLVVREIDISQTIRSLLSDRCLVFFFDCRND